MNNALLHKNFLPKSDTFLRRGVLETLSANIQLVHCLVIKVISSFVGMLRLISVMALETETCWQQVTFGSGSSCAVLPKMQVVPWPGSVRSYWNIVVQGWTIPNRSKPITFDGPEIIDNNPIFGNWFGILFQLAVVLHDALQTTDEQHWSCTF